MTYENQRWVEHFKETREVVLQLTKKIKPLIAVYIYNLNLIGIRVACSFYKKIHGKFHL
jgi:hypothetical protein